MLGLGWLLHLLLRAPWHQPEEEPGRGLAAATSAARGRLRLRAPTDLRPGASALAVLGRTEGLQCVRSGGQAAIWQLIIHYQPLCWSKSKLKDTFGAHLPGKLLITCNAGMGWLLEKDLKELSPEHCC